MDGLDGAPRPRRSPRVLPDPGYTMERLGGLMAPRQGSANEAEGVLNPASARDAAGVVHLFPRVVAAGNYSRIGHAEVKVDGDGTPRSVRRRGVALQPAESWERNQVTAGVEDPRITTMPLLGAHVMTYTAYGPGGPRVAVAVSRDLEHWERLGQVSFAYDRSLGIDLNVIDNKDAVFFPDPVPGPGGKPCFAMLHRPVWGDAGPPRGVTDPRPGIWISYVAVDDVMRDPRRLTSFTDHRQVALPEHAWEALKIGAGTPPVRVAEGWMIVHHGVSGAIKPGVDQQQGVVYSAGVMILDANDPSRVISRSATPVLAPQGDAERNGIVPNVVFPTAIETAPDGGWFVFYGMADSRIGVAKLRHGAG